MDRVMLLALAGCGRLGFSPIDDTGAAGPGDAQADTSVITGDAVAACTRVALADNFDDGVRASAWTPLANNPVTIAEASGQLQVTLATAGGSHYGGYDSAAMFDFRDHCMFVTIVQPPNNQPMVEMNVAVRTSANAMMGFAVHATEIDPCFNAGAFTSFGPIPFDIQHHTLLLREDAGTTTWATSPDGITYNVIAQQPTPINVSAVYVILEAGTFGSAANPGVAIYDNFNAP